jgi:hypothetical protein
MEIDGVFAFKNIEDMMKFLIWVSESFDSNEEFMEWLESKEECADSIDSQFWSIIENGYSKEIPDVPGSN